MVMENTNEFKEGNKKLEKSNSSGANGASQASDLA
jgi:hypothetical protein